MKLPVACILACIFATAAIAMPTEATAVGREEGDIRIRVDRAIAEWRTDSSRPRSELTEKLVELGAPAEEYLALLLTRKSDAAAVEPIATALGRIGIRADSVVAIASLLESALVSERACGISALGEMGKLEALPYLIDGLDDPDYSVRAVAAASALIVQHKNPDLVIEDHLARRQRKLGHKDHYALLLGRLGTPAARKLLRDLISQWYDEPATLSGLAGLWIGGTAEDGEAVHDLLLRADSIAIQKKACLVLGRLRDRESIRTLIDCLQGEERSLVQDAHWALLQITGLQLRADPDLWELWWQRSGEAESRQTSS